MELSHSHNEKTRAYLVSFWVNLFLPPLKLIVGAIGKSPALVADGINSLADVISNIVVYFFLKISGKPRDDNHTYGHGKYETVASFGIAAMMIIAAAFIIADSVMLILNYITDGVLPPQPRGVVLVIALIAMGLKVGAYLYTDRKSKEIGSDALHAEALNHKGDILSSFVVFVGAGASLLFGGWAQLLEPVAAILVAALIIEMGVSVWRPSLAGLTDAAVSSEVEKEILQVAASVPKVYDPHNLRTRMIGSERMAIEMDICIDGSKSLYEAHALAHQVQEALWKHFGVQHHIVIHQEPAFKEGGADPYDDGI